MCALEKQRFIPEDRGRLVTAFLERFFERYVDYDFTAELEEKLDDISGGRIDWQAVLRDFWARLQRRRRRHQGPADQRRDRRAGRGLGPHFFPRRAATAATRAPARPAPTAGSA